MFGEVVELRGCCVDLDVEEGLFVAQEEVASTEFVLMSAFLTFEGGGPCGALRDRRLLEGGELFDLIFTSEEALCTELCEFFEGAIGEIVVVVGEVFEGESDALLEGGRLGIFFGAEMDGRSEGIGQDFFVEEPRGRGLDRVEASEVDVRGFGGRDGLYGARTQELFAFAERANRRNCGEDGQDGQDGQDGRIRGRELWEGWERVIFV